MNDIISIVDGEIRLCSGMGENAFGKTNYNSIITQQGILASCTPKKDEPIEKCHFTFDTWCFNEVKSFEVPGYSERQVFYCGKNPLSENAKSLNQFFEANSQADQELAYKAGLIICTILTQAARENNVFPVNGGGGILIEDFSKSQEIKILFLPPNLFKYSSGGLSPKEQSVLQGYWLNPTLFNLPALCFERSAIAYKMLTGRFPFPAEEVIERNADILDHKFLPLELSVNGVNKELAKAVNKGLMLNSNAVEIPGKKAKGKKSEDLLPEPDFPLQLLREAKDNKTSTHLSEKEFSQKAEAYMKSKTSAVNAKRRLRRNTTVIVVSLILAAALGIFTYSSIKSNLDSYWSKGLTSTQTAEAFYKGVNGLDTVFLENLIKGKAPERYVNTVSTIYVLGKNRVAYNHDMGYLSPAAYFLYATDIEKNRLAGLYGVTNVTIDGKVSDLNPPLHKKNEKIEPLTEEKNIQLTDGYKSIHTITYYLLHTEDEAQDIEVDYVEDTMTLTYKKDRWLITDLVSKSTPIKINSNQFKTAYYAGVKRNNGDVIKTIYEMQLSYPWLPRKPLLIKQQEENERAAHATLSFF